MKLTNKHRRERLRRSFKACRRAFEKRRLTELYGDSYSFSTLWLMTQYSGYPSLLYEPPPNLELKDTIGDMAKRHGAALREIDEAERFVPRGFMFNGGGTGEPFRGCVYPQQWLDREKEHDPDVPI